MKTMEDLPTIALPVPDYLPRKGRWIQNGPISNMSAGTALVRYRSVCTHFVEPAYVAAKSPDTIVSDGRGGTQAFHQQIASTDPSRVKPLGKPVARGGLVDTRTDWECVCIGAMATFLAQKFDPGTPEADWLVRRKPESLVEFSNWFDDRWGLAFRDGQGTARGRNALGLLLILAQRRLMSGRKPATADEADWAVLQAHLVPVMIEASRTVFA